MRETVQVRCHAESPSVGFTVACLLTISRSISSPVIHVVDPTSSRQQALSFPLIPCVLSPLTSPALSLFAAASTNPAAPGRSGGGGASGGTGGGGGSPAAGSPGRTPRALPELRELCSLPALPELRSRRPRSSARGAEAGLRERPGSTLPDGGGDLLGGGAGGGAGGGRRGGARHQRRPRPDPGFFSFFHTIFFKKMLPEFFCFGCTFLFFYLINFSLSNFFS